MGQEDEFFFLWWPLTARMFHYLVHGVDFYLNSEIKTFILTAKTAPHNN